MKCIVDSQGRECSSCREYKAWDMFGNRKGGTRGHQENCRYCRSLLRCIGFKPKKVLCAEDIANDIMKHMNDKIYNDRQIELTKAFKDNSRLCQKCSKYKNNDKFEYVGKGKKNSNPYSKLCNDCRCGLSCTDYNKQAKKINWMSKIKGLIKDSITTELSNGFVYLYWSNKLECFKIGRTKYSPFSYIKGKSNEYGLELEMVAFIICPIRDVDIERYVFHSIKSVRVEHIKPCGGNARELFKCDIHDVLRVFSTITDKIYIEPNPFVCMDDIGCEILTRDELNDVCKIKGRSTQRRHNDVRRNRCSRK